MITLKSYSSFRLVMTRQADNQTSGYYAVSLWQMFPEYGGEGGNLLQGGVATAQSYQGSYLPANAFDGSTSTTWESSSNAQPGVWLRYDLPEPVTPKSFRLAHQTWGGETPRDFTIEGSNDNGETWEVIADIVGFATGKVDRILDIAIFLGGFARLDYGVKADKVRLHRWDNGAHVADITPDDDGFWRYGLTNRIKYSVTIIGPEGYRPVCEGPITPYEVI